MDPRSASTANVFIALFQRSGDRWWWIGFVANKMSMLSWWNCFCSSETTWRRHFHHSQFENFWKKPTSVSSHGRVLSNHNSWRLHKMKLRCIRGYPISIHMTSTHNDSDVMKVIGYINQSQRYKNNIINKCERYFHRRTSSCCPCISKPSSYAAIGNRSYNTEACFYKSTGPSGVRF